MSAVLRKPFYLLLNLSVGRAMLHEMIIPRRPSVTMHHRKFLTTMMRPLSNLSRAWFEVYEWVELRDGVRTGYGLLEIQLQVVRFSLSSVRTSSTCQSR